MDYRLLSLLTIVCWGIWGFLTKILCRTTPAETVAFWSTLASILPILAYTLSTGTMRWMATTPLTLVSGTIAGLATIFFYLAMNRGPASVVIPLTGMYIIIPVLLGYLILKEPVNIKHILGFTCALLAILLLSN